MKTNILFISIFIVALIGIYLIDINNDSNNIETITYNGKNLRISIDGEASNTLPTSGSYYLVDYFCKDSSTKIEWDKNNYKLNVTNGNKKNDVACYLTFKSNPLLSEMEKGSYVAYTGDSMNGCDVTNIVNGYTSCSGKNANYVSDTEMGYCDYSGYKFHVNGWRIAYTENDSAYLISAGAPECTMTYVSIKSSSTFDGGLSKYYFGSGYIFDEVTGEYTLTGVTADKLDWSTNYESIISDTPYTCMFYGLSCSTLREIVSYNSDTGGAKYYEYYNYEEADGAPIHLANLESKALKYCNSDYAKGGLCDESTSWAMNAIDFEKITGSILSSSSCEAEYGNKVCGYNNDLIDNGETYWLASSNSNGNFWWYGMDRVIYNSYVNIQGGVRPVLALASSVIVTGGDGTYERPYLISNYSFRINDGASYISASDDKSQVQLSLMGVDVAKMCISVDTSVCTNYIDYSDTYTLDWSSEADGEKTVYVYYKDSNGDIVASMSKSITIDTTS